MIESEDGWSKARSLADHGNQNVSLLLNQVSASGVTDVFSRVL